MYCSVPIVLSFYPLLIFMKIFSLLMFKRMAKDILDFVDFKMLAVDCVTNSCAKFRSCRTNRKDMRAMMRSNQSSGVVCLDHVGQAI